MEQSKQLKPAECQNHCQKCRKDIVYYNNFCKNCFSELIEKRIRKYLRETVQIQKNEVLLINNVLCEYFIKKIITMPIKIQQAGKGRKILCWTMDDEIDVFLCNLFDKAEIKPEKKQSKENKKTIKLFLPLTDKELEYYTKIKNLPWKAKKRKYDFLLNKLEEKHKETRYSLINSIETLKKILKN